MRQRSAWFIPLCRCTLEHPCAQEDQPLPVHPEKGKFDTGFVLHFHITLQQRWNSLYGSSVPQDLPDGNVSLNHCKEQELLTLRVLSLISLTAVALAWRQDPALQLRITVGWRLQGEKRWQQVWFYLLEGLGDPKIQVFQELPNGIKTRTTLQILRKSSRCSFSFDRTYKKNECTYDPSKDHHFPHPLTGGQLMHW